MAAEAEPGATGEEEDAILPNQPAREPTGRNNKRRGKAFTPEIAQLARGIFRLDKRFPLS